jgi:hypothetical protein
MTFKAVFPEFLAPGRSGRACPVAVEAVSGRNILILTVEASILPPVSRLAGAGR